MPLCARRSVCRPKIYIRITRGTNGTNGTNGTRILGETGILGKKKAPKTAPKKMSDLFHDIKKTL